MSIATIVSDLFDEEGMTRGLAYFIGLAAIEDALEHLYMHPVNEEKEYFPLSGVYDAARFTRGRLIEALDKALEGPDYGDNLKTWAAHVDSSDKFEIRPPSDGVFVSDSLDRRITMGVEEAEFTLNDLLAAPESYEASQRDGSVWEEEHYD